jgi:hypothetical protein
MLSVLFCRACAPDYGRRPNLRMAAAYTTWPQGRSWSGPSARSAKSSHRPSARRSPSFPERVKRGTGRISLSKDALAQCGARGGLYQQSRGNAVDVYPRC